MLYAVLSVIIAESHYIVPATHCTLRPHTRTNRHIKIIPRMVSLVSPLGFRPDSSLFVCSGCVVGLIVRSKGCMCVRVFVCAHACLRETD